MGLHLSTQNVDPTAGDPAGETPNRVLAGFTDGLGLSRRALSTQESHELIRIRFFGPRTLPPSLLRRAWIHACVLGMGVEDYNLLGM